MLTIFERNCKQMILKTLENEFVKLYFYEKFVIAEIKEGIDLNEEHVDVLIQSSLDFYGVKPFGYITNKVNSYSVNPVIFFKTSKIKNLVALAAVSTNSLDRYNIQLERAFSTKPHELFDSIEEAVNWVTNAVEAYKE